MGGNKMNRRLISICICAFLFFSFFGFNVNANELELNEEINATLEELLQYEPDATKEAILDQVKLYMKEYDIPYTEENLHKQLKQGIEDHRNNIKLMQEYSSTIPSSEGSTMVPLHEAHKGKTFYSPSSTFGVEHGHNGLYGTNYSVSHANPGTGVTYDLARHIMVAEGTSILSVRASQSTVDTAVSRAHKFHGQGYNYLFLNNKFIEIMPANCSQLVWAAYKYAGLDLDIYPAASGIFPITIYYSDKTFVWKTI